MDAKITREILESSLNCKYKGYLKLIREQGNVSPYRVIAKRDQRSCTTSSHA